MDIAQELQFFFDEKIKEFPVPAADFWEATVEILRSPEQRQKAKEQGFPEALLGTLTEGYDRDPKAYEANAYRLAKECRDESISTAQRKLDALTKLVLIDAVQRTQAEKANRLFDGNHRLLELSVTEDVLSRLSDAVRRSRKLLEWRVAEASSEEADRYLSEACNCFIYGFFTASAVMCRSLLEEMTWRKLPQQLRSKLKDETFGRILSAAKNPLALDDTTVKALEDVKNWGNDAAHQDPVDELVALKCIKKTHAAVQHLLKG